MAAAIHRSTDDGAIARVSVAALAWQIQVDTGISPHIRPAAFREYRREKHENARPASRPSRCCRRFRKAPPPSKSHIRSSIEVVSCILASFGEVQRLSDSSADHLQPARWSPLPISTLAIAGRVGILYLHQTSTPSSLPHNRHLRFMADVLRIFADAAAVDVPNTAPPARAAPVRSTLLVALSRPAWSVCPWTEFLLAGYRCAGIWRQ